MKHVLITLLLLSAFMFGCDDDNNEDPSPTIDLSAESVEFDLNKETSTTGTVIIRGTVKNIGADYVSDAGKQKVTLSEKHPGGQATVVDEAEFTNLSAGATIEVKYFRDWNAAAEFPPSYILTISYGPDIYIDGNEQNDDENNENNRLERSGSEINDMF